MRSHINPIALRHGFPTEIIKHKAFTFPIGAAIINQNIKNYALNNRENPELSTCFQSGALHENAYEEAS